MSRVTALLMLCSLAVALARAHAADVFTVAPDLWDRPRTAQAVYEQASVRQAMHLHLSQPGSQLTIHHGYGQDPLLQAEELRARPMALSIDGAAIRLANDTPASEPLKIEVIK